MERRSRFKDSQCEVVWRAIEALDPSRQLLLLRDLATVYSLSARNPRTAADKVRAAVNALRDVADVLGRSPSVAESIENIRSTHPTEVLGNGVQKV